MCTILLPQSKNSRINLDILPSFIKYRDHHDLVRLHAMKLASLEWQNQNSVNYIFTFHFPNLRIKWI